MQQTDNRATRLKICGIRHTEDVMGLNQLQYPPDYAGFILSAPFWRYIPPQQLQKLHGMLRPEIRRVGVFVNPDIQELDACMPFLDVIQLHGEESADFITLVKAHTGLELWKAVRVRCAADIQEADNLPVEKLVLDSFSAVSHGGTGTVAPWQLIAENRPEKPFFLAGGISESNLTEAIRQVHPFGVDVSSSVETEKRKDMQKIRRITELVYPE